MRASENLPPGYSWQTMRRSGRYQGGKNVKRLLKRFSDYTDDWREEPDQAFQGLIWHSGHQLGTAPEVFYSPSFLGLH